MSGKSDTHRTKLGILEARGVLKPPKPPTESATDCSTTKELLNASFSFETGLFQHKLWPLKVSSENKPDSEKNTH